LRKLQGDTAQAKSAYQDFFAVWKDADPDIPVLKQAKVEYAKFAVTTEQRAPLHSPSVVPIPAGQRESSL